MEIQIRNQSMDPEKVLEKFHILGTIHAKTSKRGASAHIFQNSLFFIRDVRTSECRYISKDLSEVFICGFGDPTPFFGTFCRRQVNLCVFTERFGCEIRIIEIVKKKWKSATPSKFLIEIFISVLRFLGVETGYPTPNSAS